MPSLPDQTLHVTSWEKTSGQNYLKSEKAQIKDIALITRGEILDLYVSLCAIAHARARMP